MLKKIGLLLLILGLITGMPLTTPAQDKAEEELLALDEDTMNSILDELIGQMGEDQAPASVTTAKETQKSAVPAETTAEEMPEAMTEDELAESAMTIPASSAAAGSAGIPLEAEPTAVEPDIEQEAQAAETVAEPPEPEALEELAADAEPAEMEAAAAGMEPPEMEPAAAGMEPPEMEPAAAGMEPLEMEPAAAEMEPPEREAAAAGLEPMALEGMAASEGVPVFTGAAMDAQPRAWQGGDAAEAEPSAFAEAENMDFQTVPETESEIIPAPAFEEPVKTEADESLFGSTESLTTSEPEPMEPAGGISQPLAEAPREEAASVRSAPREEESEIVEMEASAPAAAGRQGKMIKSEQIINNSIKISRQREDHILITVGDVVFLPTPTFKTIRPEEKYFIYKKVKKRLPGIGSQPLTWFEKVGKLKILEINNQLSIARVIAAHDVIEKGDMVYLSNYP